MRKSLSFILCSSMINKFNNKTSSILDNPFSKKIKLYKNIFNFRKKIINDYIDQDKIIGNMESSKIKYKDALDYFEEKREIKIQKLLKSEKQFYKLKNKEIGIYEIGLDDEGEDNKENNRRYNSFKSSKNFDFIQIKNENNNENLINIKKRTLSSKNFNFKFILSKKIITNFLDKNNNKNSLDNKIYFNYENEGENKKEKIQKTSNHINESLESKKFFIENTSRINSNTININNKNLYNLNNFNYNNIFSKNKKKILKNPIFNNNSEYKVKQYKKKFLLFQKKKITERSKKFANSMANMYFFQYKPKDYIDYKNATLNINSQNLTRVIKLNRINKYLCDVEDDDLLVINSKKLRQLMKQAELKYYLCNKKDFELSYLKKNLKPQTISKFCRIKNSFFGLPC